MAQGIKAITFNRVIGGWPDSYKFMGDEAAGPQTFSIGAPLQWSSGQLQVVADVTTPALVGFALNDATGTQGDDCQVMTCLPECIFEVSVDTNTNGSGSAAPGTGKPTDFTIGTTYDMYLDSTSGNYFMSTGTSNQVFQLLGYDPTQAGVVQGRVWVRVLTTQTFWT